MMKIALLTIVGALALSGCVSNYTEPGKLIRSDKVITKTGTATCPRVFGTFGDCSISKAVKNGDLNSTIAVDHKKVRFFLGIFGADTTIVSGD